MDSLILYAGAKRAAFALMMPEHLPLPVISSTLQNLLYKIQVIKCLDRATVPIRFPLLAFLLGGFDSRLREVCSSKGSLPFSCDIARPVVGRFKKNTLALADRVVVVTSVR